MGRVMNRLKRWVVLVSLLAMLAVPAVAYAEASIYKRLNYGEGTVYSASSSYKWLRASQATRVDSVSCSVTARIQSRSTTTGTWYNRTALSISPGTTGSNSTSYSSTQYWRLSLAASIWGTGFAEGVLNIFN